MALDQNASGAPKTNPEDGSGDSNNSSGIDDVVSRSSYQKLLNEKKKRDEEVRQLREIAENAKLEKLQAEGKKDEMITELQKKLNLESESRKKEKEAFVFSTVNSQIKRKADSMGCVDSNSLMKLLDKEDFAKLTVSDNFEVDETSLEEVLSNAKNKYAGLNLFGGKKPNVNNPAGSFMSPQPKDISKLSNSELEAEIKRLDELERNKDR